MRLDDLKTEYILRRFEPRDASSIVACIRDAYGESYVKPFLYHESEILRLDEKGEMCFSVAEAENGDIAGITAFERDELFKGLGEIACQIVRSEYGGQGLALDLALHSMHEAEKEDFTGQFARALGCHLISQKTLKRMGFTACGFILNIFDKELFLHKFENGDYAKIPQSVAAKKQNKQNAGRVWIPESLLPLAKSIYSEMGVAAEFYSENSPLSGEDSWSSSQDDKHNTLTLMARGCGVGFESRLKAEIEKVSGRKGQSINLYINLSRSGSAAAYSIAREQGFIFTGFLPCCADGEYIIMHDPLDLPVLIDEIPHIPEYHPFIEEIRRQLCKIR